MKPSAGARTTRSDGALLHQGVVVDHPRITALTLDDRPEPIQRLSGDDRAPAQGRSLSAIGSATPAATRLRSLSSRAFADK